MTFTQQKQSRQLKPSKLETADEWFYLMNYARFRDDDEGDYGRTKRQQQVMSSVLEQVKDPSRLFTGSEALGKAFAMTSTNLPYSFLLTNGLSVLEGAQNGIERLTVPPNLVTGQMTMMFMEGRLSLSTKINTRQNSKWE